MAKKSIVIAEDEPGIAKSLAMMLEERGYAITIAGNGSQALELIKSKKPDLVLLDIVMPGMDGTQVAQALKKDKATQSIPVIFLTALQRKGDELKLISTGKDITLAKPFEFQEVLKAVGQLIGEV